MNKSFSMEIVAPDKLSLKQEVTQVNLPGMEGDFTVLRRHSPFFSLLRPGTLRVYQDDQVQLYFVSGGFVEVNPKALTILAESYDRPEEIDEEHERNELRMAEERLRDHKPHLDPARSKKVALLAKARLRTAEEARVQRKAPVPK